LPGNRTLCPWFHGEESPWALATIAPTATSAATPAIERRLRPFARPRGLFLDRISFSL
jgi:hypothetical protein